MKPGRRVALALIVLAAVVLATTLDALGPLGGVDTFEDVTLDLRQRTTAESFQAGVGERESEIVLVLFDEFSVMDSIDGWEWISPFPREPLAELIDALAAAGARTIGLDVYVDRLYPRLPGDSALRAAIERAGNVVLVSPVEETDTGWVAAPPHPFFAEVAADVGTAELPASFEMFRHGAFAARSGDGLEPSFALALYAHANGVDSDSLLAAAQASGRIDLPGLPPRVGRIDRSLGEDGRASLVPFRIRFVGPPSSTDATDQAGTFTALASSSVSALTLFMPEQFEDRIVILGTGFHPEDRFRTPFYGWAPAPSETLPEPDPYGWMYGVEVHANALQNMLDGEYVRPMGAGGRALLLLLTAVVTGLVTFRRGAWWGAGATVGAGLVLAVGAWWAWAGEVNLFGATVVDLDARFLWLPVTAPFLSAVFAYVGSVGYVSIVEGKEKRFIKGAFGMFLSPEKVEEIAEDPSALQLGGEKRPLTLLFSDLAGFSGISEELDAQELVAFLNEYLEEMSEIVIEEQGYVDKYIGDAVMAFWNAPVDVPDHADRALRAAVRMQRRIGRLNERWAARNPDHEPLAARIGVHTGEVVVGMIGGEGSINYSAIGDDVNLAARLEPANKDYGTLTMVTEETLAAAGGTYRVRELDYIAVYGKEEPARVFELLEEGDAELPPDRERALELYAEGMTLYKRHEWAAARQRFERALDVWPDDGPSRVYAERCDEHIDDPPPPDWDFVVRRTKK